MHSTVVNVVSQSERLLIECCAGSDLLTPGEFVLDGTESIAAGPGGETPVQLSWPENTCRAPGLRPSDRETTESIEGGGGWTFTWSALLPGLKKKI